MAIEHMKTWRVGRVEITRIVEVWKWEDDIGMALEGGNPSMVLAQPWLLPQHATPEGRMFINFQAFVDAGAVAQEDLDQFKIVDSPEEAFEFLRDGLTKYHLGGTPKKEGEVVPDIAKTRP